MKIRSDFVTNSSSSSFVVVFKDEEDMQNNCEQIAEIDEDFAQCFEEDFKENRCDRDDVYAVIFRKCLSDAFDKFVYADNDWGKMSCAQFYAKRGGAEAVRAEMEAIAKERADKLMLNLKEGIYSVVEYDTDLYETWMETMPFVFMSISHH